MTHDDAILTRREQGVLVITLNRPEVRNAINGAMSTMLAAAIDELDNDDTLSVGVLAGAGGTFSAGMDLNAFLAGEKIVTPGRGLGFTARPPRKPLIAAVEGYALAGGMELALACDLIVSSTGAKFGLPETKRGLVAAAGGLFRLPQRIPYQKALEFLLTGDHFPAEEAHRLGLVNRLTGVGEAESSAVELAATIAQNGPLAVQITKEIVQASRDWPAYEAFANQRPSVSEVFASDDAKEGALAFTEKRAPQWVGH